jgi:hypothetical protein
MPAIETKKQPAQKFKSFIFDFKWNFHIFPKDCPSIEQLPSAAVLASGGREPLWRDIPRLKPGGLKQSLPVLPASRAQLQPEPERAD